MAAGITTALRLRERTHSRNRQQTNRARHTPLISTVLKKTEPISCRGLKRNFWCTDPLLQQHTKEWARGSALTYGSTTATTLQEWARGSALSHRALRLRTRAHSRNDQQTNRSWHTLLVSTVPKKTKPISCRGLKRNFWCTDPLLQQHSKEWARGSALSHRALRLRARTHFRIRQQIFLEHIPRLNCPEENEAYLVPRVEEKLLVHRSSTATTLQRVGERFRTVPSGADRRSLSNSAAGVTTALRLRERTHSRNRQQTNRSWHTYLVSTIPKKTKPDLVPRVEEKLLVHRSSTATTLQRVGERFRTVPSGADRRGLSNSAAGITTALRLRERTHSRNRQQTNRSWHPLLVQLSRRQQSLSRAEG